LLAAIHVIRKISVIKKLRIIYLLAAIRVIRKISAIKKI